MRAGLDAGKLGRRRSLDDSSSEEGVVGLELLRVEVEGGVHEALVASGVARVAGLGSGVVVEDKVLREKGYILEKRAVLDLFFH